MFDPYYYSMYGFFRRKKAQSGGGEQVLWTPRNITTAAWYDASDSDTITEIGGAISQWSDKSGNLRHMIQDTSTRRPLRTTLGGLDVVSFQSDYMTVAGYNPDGEITTYFVAATDRTLPGPANTVDVVLCTRNSGSTTPGWCHALYNSFGSTTIRRWLAQGTGSTFTDYLDGVIDTNSELGYQTPHVFASLINATTGGGPLTMGVLADLQYFGNSYIHEVIIVSGQDSQTSRWRMEGYLAHKWGLTANLPSGHTYKTNPPYV